MLKITTVQFIVFCLAAADFSFPPKNSARPHTPQGRIRKREVEVQIAGRVARKHREMRLFCGNDCPILWPERRNDRYINGLEGSWGEVKLRSEVRLAGGKGLDLDRASPIRRGLIPRSAGEIGLWTANMTAA